MATRKTAPSQTPSSMAAGGTSGTSKAMTAPGSPPQGLPPPDELDEPEMAADRIDGRHLVHGERGSGGPTGSVWLDARGE
jgi:hypothetical protein